MVVIQSLWQIMLASLVQIIYFLVYKVLSTPTLNLPWFRELATSGCLWPFTAVLVTWLLWSQDTEMKPSHASINVQEKKRSLPESWHFLNTVPYTFTWRCYGHATAIKWIRTRSFTVSWRTSHTPNHRSSAQLQTPDECRWTGQGWRSWPSWTVCISVVEHMHNMCEALGSIPEQTPSKEQQKHVWVITVRFFIGDRICLICQERLSKYSVNRWQRMNECPWG